MKTLLIGCGIFLASFAASAQNSNAILFTENGERFQVILNGILQNSNPETNVKLTELPANRYKCRILFADTSLGYVDFNLVFPEQGYEVTWNVKKNNKGEYVVRYVSDVPIASAPVSTPSQSVIVFTTTPATNVTSTTVQQTQTTSRSENEGVSINMGINTNGEGGNISIHASGKDGSMNQNGYSSTTTTTTTSQTVVTTTTTSDSEPPIVPASKVVYVTGYNGKVGCPVPLNPSEFNDVKNTIRSKDFEETKLTISKQIIMNNCLTSSQVREVLGLFNFETTRLDFAKYAYERTYDIGNYYKVNDAFEFESSVDELNKFISSK